MKYIIEIKPEYEDSFKGLMILGAKDSNLFVDTLAVENLEELNSDYINDHFGDLQDTAYQKGFEKGKDVRIKGCEGCMYQDTTIEYNPCNLCCNAFLNRWTAKDDKIRVGDMVIGTVGNNGIVTNSDDEDKAYVVWDDGSCGPIERKALTKAGRHYSIEKILEDMKHD